MNEVMLNKYEGSSTKINFHGIPYISFPALERLFWIRHGFSTRLGGVSSKHLASLNLAFHRGDLEQNVHQNFERIADAIGFEVKNLVLSHQTHTTNIRQVTKEDCGKGIFKERDFENIDGLITNEKNVVLATSYADCVPLYLADRKNHAIGLSHSGWRGTVGKIGQKTIQKMKEAYGTEPEDLIVCIGPSICQDCYEISEDVAEEFKASFPNDVDAILRDKGNGKYHLNLWKCNELIFLEAGVLPENIHVTDLCTCCNPEVLFSHRALHGMRGTLMAFLEII